MHPVKKQCLFACWHHQEAFPSALVLRRPATVYRLFRFGLPKKKNLLAVPNPHIIFHREVSPHKPSASFNMCSSPPSTLVTSNIENQGRRTRRRPCSSSSSSSSSSSIDSEQTTADVQTETNNNKKISTKKVSFYCNVAVIYTLHLDDYSEEEMKDCFYGSLELKRIRKQAKATVRYIMSSSSSTSSEDDEFSSSSSSSTEDVEDEEDLCQEQQSHCTRGLEYCTPALRELRSQVKMLAREAVLDEQEYQQMAGVADPERLATVYKDQTNESLYAAMMIGKSDEYIARQIHFHHHQALRAMEKKTTVATTSSTKPHVLSECVTKNNQCNQPKSRLFKHRRNIPRRVY